MAEEKKLGDQTIEIKNREEYLKLDDTEKAHWVIYNPASSGDEYNELVQQISAMKASFDDIKVTYEQMKADPLMVKTATYSAISSAAAILIDALTPIVKLINDTVLGTLVKPLVDFLKALLKVLGMIIMLVCTTMKQAWLNGKAVVENLQQIDYNGIFVENTKKALGGKSAAEVDWDLIPMKKAEKLALERELTIAETTLKADVAWQEMVKARKTELLQQSVDKLCETLVKPWAEVLDIDWKKLIGYDQEALDAIVPNPTLASGNLAKRLNKLAENKYIQKKDLAAIEQYYIAKKSVSDEYIAMYNDQEAELAEVKKELDNNEITLGEYKAKTTLINLEYENTKKELDSIFDGVLDEEKAKAVRIFKMTNKEYEEELLAIKKAKELAEAAKEESEEE